jgi:DNA-binding transcriptional MerR regulator
MVTDRYTAKQVIRLTGVSYQTLNLWAKSGFIRPSVTGSAGRGTDRIYNFEDLVSLKVARDLRNAGVSTKALPRIINRVREFGIADSLAGIKFMVIGKDIEVMAGDRTLTSVLRRPGQMSFAFVVDVPKIIVELKKTAKSESSPPRIKRGLRSSRRAS